MKNLKQIHLFISGKVQGVALRLQIWTKARELGLKGFVKNLKDGRVETVLEGDISATEEMVKWIKNEPRFATIDQVEKAEEKFTGEFDDFAIL